MVGVTLPGSTPDPSHHVETVEARDPPANPDYAQGRRFVGGSGHPTTLL
jgi:hypothetical protein